MKLLTWLRRRLPSPTDWSEPEAQLFTYEQMKRAVDKAYAVGHTDGKREGIALSRKLAENQLKEVLWQQNQNHSQTKIPTQR